MSTSPKPQREHPSTYFVQDRSNGEEMLRLQVQDRMVTANMGGVLPEQDDPACFQRVLDVACGIGYWLIETAKTYPTASLLIGVDISNKMVEYAREQAQVEGVAERVEFHTMDALRMLEFPNDYFDLVNERLASSFLRSWDWSKFLQEFVRVTKPGGIVRLTEVSYGPSSNSPALTSLFEMMGQAVLQSGRVFKEEGSFTDVLVKLLKQAGVQDVQTRTYAQDYRAGTQQTQLFIEDMRLSFRTLAPFIRKWVPVSVDYDALYQQALNEMQQADFAAHWPIHTVWGLK